MAARSSIIPRKSNKPAESEPVPQEDRIRQRAYELYLERGGADGNELDDWLRAEDEISGKMRSSGVA